VLTVRSSVLVGRPAGTALGALRGPGNRGGSGSGTFEKLGQRKAALYVAAISLTSASAGVTGLWTTMLRFGRPLAKTPTSARAVLRMHPILPPLAAKKRSRDAKMR
jgi:hypothetical protein